MTEVHRQDGFTIHIFGPPREHKPPHVHVRRADAVLVVRLGNEAIPANAWKNYGMSDRGVVNAMRIVQANKDQFLTTWAEVHSGQ